MHALLKTLFTRGYSAIAAFVLSVLIARILSTEDLGIYFSGLTITAGIAIIVRFGFENYLIKMNSESKEDKISNFLTLTAYSLGLFVTLSLIGLMALYLFNWDIQIGGRVILYFWLSSLFFAMLIIASGFLKSVGRSPLANFTEAGLIPTGLIPCYLFLLDKMSLELAAQVYFSLTSISVATLYLYIIWGYSGTIRVKKIEWTRIIESSGIMISGLLDFMVLWFSALILINYATLSEVADFQVAQRLSILISFILVVVNSLTAPIYARLFNQGDILKAGEVFGVSNALMTTLAIFPLLLFWFVPDFLLGFFGDDYRDAGLILIILSVGQLINVMSGSVGYVLMMSGHSHLYRNSSLCAAILAVALALGLVPILGAIGAAVASSIGLAAKNLIGVFFVSRLFGFPSFPNINRLVKILTFKETYEVFSHRD